MQSGSRWSGHDILDVPDDSFDRRYISDSRGFFGGCCGSDSDSWNLLRSRWRRTSIGFWFSWLRSFRTTRRISQFIGTQSSCLFLTDCFSRWDNDTCGYRCTSGKWNAAESTRMVVADEIGDARRTDERGKEIWKRNRSSLLRSSHTRHILECHGKLSSIVSFARNFSNPKFKKKQQLITNKN